MNESRIERKVCHYAKSKGWLVFKFLSPSNRGVPDRIFIRKGKVIFVEFKSLNKKPTKLQTLIASKIESELIRVYLIDSIEKGYNLFNSYEEIENDTK